MAGGTLFGSGRNGMVSVNSEMRVGMCAEGCGMETVYGGRAGEVGDGGI